MKKSRADLKNEAKQTLSGQWSSAIALNLVPTIISIIVAAIISYAVYDVLLLKGISLSSLLSSNDNISYVVNSGSSNSGYNFIGRLVSFIFTAGISWTYLDLLRHRKEKIAPLTDAFRAFRTPVLLRIIGLYLVIFLFSFLWALLLVIPAIIKSFSYSQSIYIYYDELNDKGNALGILDTITASRRLMNGHKMELLLLRLSFIPWHILALLTFGLGYLWLNPYISATNAAFYRMLADNR